jgi:toxin YoeB
MTPVAPKSRKCVVDPHCMEDLLYWARQKPTIAAKVLELMQHALRDPSAGLGKPEKLKGIANLWSRRITLEHRLVYLVQDDRIDFLQARYHYE